MRSSIWLLALPFIVGCVAPNSDEEFDDIPDAPFGGKGDSSRIFVSAQSVDELGGDLSSLTPPCRTADPYHDCEFYLSSASALGVTLPAPYVEIMRQFPDDLRHWPAWAASEGESFSSSAFRSTKTSSTDGCAGVARSGRGCTLR